MNHEEDLAVCRALELVPCMPRSVPLFKNVECYWAYDPENRAYRVRALWSGMMCYAYFSEHTLAMVKDPDYIRYGIEEQFRRHVHEQFAE